MKRTHRMAALSAASLMLALALSACSNGNNASPSPSESQPASVAPATESASPTASSEAQASSGDYVGLIDGHSIEIKTSNGTEVFQIDPEIAEKVADWEEGTKVNFQYTEAELEVDGSKAKQKTIATIDKE